MRVRAQHLMAAGLLAVCLPLGISAGASAATVAAVPRAAAAPAYPAGSRFAPQAAPAVSQNYYNATFTSKCSGWNFTTDSNGQPNAYTASTGTTNCANVDWYISGTPTHSKCVVWVFVPGAFANASHAVPGLWNTSGTKLYGNTINENLYTDQWAYIGTFTNINHVNIGDNDGETGTWLGTGVARSINFICGVN
ncbi:MAG TPA: hypothetical protein VGS19_20340 [Streptosporangiaceae bacterium]|nr:hypothetical protein [Streptosporangiaceae bacterium]